MLFRQLVEIFDERHRRTVEALYARVRRFDDVIFIGRVGAAAMTKTEMAGIFRLMDEHFKSPLRMTVKGTVAEGDRVAVEAESYGELRNGRVYAQEYHVLMTIRDGRIAAVREYMDTAHVQAVWYTR